MKTKRNLILLTAAALASQVNGQALDKNSSTIKSWASGVQSVSYGSAVDVVWKTPNKALGKSEGNSFDVVCLGRGGQITLTFPRGISNGSGNDFAIFENGISDTFLELAWVEISSDGTHFVRFRNQSLNTSPIGTYGEVNPNNIIAGLASKYMQGYGTQFDFNHMQELYNYVSQGGGPPITTAHKTQLLNNFPYLDLNNIQYVRIIDIVGDGSARDAYGQVIYDPYPTTGSAGFDLDAVAVLHEGNTAPPPPPNTFANWSFGHGLSGTPSADFDGDGNADLEEYFFGSSPTNLSEKASFSGSSRSNQFEIVYHRDPDALGTIDVESIVDLTQTNWNIAAPDSVTSNGTKITISLPLTTNRNFYRLQFEQAEE